MIFLNPIFISFYNYIFLIFFKIFIFYFFVQLQYHYLKIISEFDMKIEKNKFVLVHYTLKNNAGEVLDSSSGKDLLVLFMVLG